MKKILSIIICLALIIAVLPLQSLNVFAEIDPYFTYEVVDDEAIITSVDESISGDITIPSTLDGYPVTSIGDYAFSYCDSLESVIIGDSVTSIGDYAFADCYSLTDITIPDSVTSIGERAFYWCSSLETVYYRGSQSQQAEIDIDDYNEDLIDAKWYYNSCIGSAEHSIDNKKCTVCDYCEYIIGDLDGNGKADTTDLAVMKLFLADLSKLNDTGLLTGDLNGDGAVNTSDLAKLKLKLAGL